MGKIGYELDGKSWDGKVRWSRKGVERAEALFCFGHDPSVYHREEKNIRDGSWVLVKAKIPVSESVRPVTYGIYWAIPNEDPYKRQSVKIYTPEEVVLLNYEYTPITEERLQEYRELGWEMRENTPKRKDDPVVLSLVEKGRALCEEEREIIYALQVDGLTERQACEEYYMTHHTDDQNVGIYYVPSEEVLEEIISVFGTDGLRG